MNDLRRIGIGIVGFLVLITVAHLSLNVDWSEWKNARLPKEQRKLNVAYIPVT